MPEFLAAFVIFVLAVVGMAIGVIVRRKSLAGSCGALANRQDREGQTACDLCTNPFPQCTGDSASEIEQEPDALTKTGAEKITVP